MLDLRHRFRSDLQSAREQTGQFHLSDKSYTQFYIYVYILCDTILVTHTGRTQKRQSAGVITKYCAIRTSLNIGIGFSRKSSFQFHSHTTTTSKRRNTRCLQLLLVVCFLYLAFVRFHFWPNHLVAIITECARAHTETHTQILGKPEQRINRRKAKKTENILLYNRVVRSTSNFFHVTYIVESMLMLNIYYIYMKCIE